jgi:DNA-binding CsgD family transcriptional regulator
VQNGFLTWWKTGHASINPMQSADREHMGLIIGTIALILVYAVIAWLWLMIESYIITLVNWLADLIATPFIWLFDQLPPHKHKQPWELVDDRDRELVRLFWSGKSSKEIGINLEISEATVNNRVSAARKRYGPEIIPPKDNLDTS